MRAITLVVLSALTAFVVPAKSPAEEVYPSRVVRIVVPYPAGGGTDTLARLLADGL